MIIEFKINHDNKPWVNVPVISIDFSQINDSPLTIAKGMADSNKAEVRWNRQGLGQGNYIGTEYKFEKLNNGML